MSQKKEKSALLESYRVLDLTDDKGLLCGKLFGDLGADVIKIEHPKGDLARNIGPFYHDKVNPELSLFWFAYNLNKRGITLDIEKKEGCEIFKELVKSADFVIESFQPGYMAGLGLGYHDLESINPRIIMVSITPFGQTGPYSNWKGTDIVGTALAGIMILNGDPDRPPLRISFPQAYMFACVDAATGAMAAHYYRECTGEGQWVDTAMMQSLASQGYVAPYQWEINNINVKRRGNIRTQQRTDTDGTTKETSSRMIWQTKDGYVQNELMGGPSGESSSKALMKAIIDDDMVDSKIKEKNWDNIELQKISQEELYEYAEQISKYFAAHTSLEIFEEAVKRRIVLAPLSNTKQIVENKQLSYRQAWVKIEHPELDDSITYPGVWAKLSGSPLAITRRAPLIGEHNHEIYMDELGFSEEKMASMKKKNVI